MQNPGSFLCGSALALMLGCSPQAAALEPVEHAELRLLHLSDLHSHLFASRERVSAADARRGLGELGEFSTFGGAARLASLIRAARADGPPALFIDTGDAVHGAPVYREFGGGPELGLLSSLGLDAHVIGNHDLDAGAAAAAARYRDFARFPVLAANYVGGSEPALASLVVPFVRLRAGALRVGVVGIANGAAPGVLVGDAAESAQAAIDAVRPVSDLVVLATHLGVDSDRALISRTSGADVVLGGHQHWVLDAPETVDDCGVELRRARGCAPRPVLLVHSGAYSKYLGVLDLRLARGTDADDGLEVVGHDYRAEPAREQVPEDTAIVEWLAPYRPAPFELVAYAPRPIERFGISGGDSALGNLAAETLRAELNVELAFVNTTALRAELPAGPISRDALDAALPFDDTIEELWLSGEELEHAFTHAAARTRERRCQAGVQLAGARLRIDCAGAGYTLESDSGLCLAGNCGAGIGSALRAVGVTGYLARGGSGFIRPERARAGRTARSSLTEALATRVRRGAPCGALAGRHEALVCSNDAECSALAQPSECLAGRCAARGCGSEVRAALRASGDARSDAELAVAAGTLCSRLPCVDARVGAVRDGRIQVVRPP